MLSLADDFAETAVQGIFFATTSIITTKSKTFCFKNVAEAENDSINDFQYLVDAWKDLTVALMSD